jgi:hypothetical protein
MPYVLLMLVLRRETDVCITQLVKEPGFEQDTIIQDIISRFRKALRITKEDSAVTDTKHALSLNWHMRCLLLFC